MDQVKEVLRYCQWILRYIRFYDGKTHPRDLGSEHIERFLLHLAVHGKVAASTQRQALNALVFLYRKVLSIQLSDSITPIRYKRQKRSPVVSTSKSEVYKYIRETYSVMPEAFIVSELRIGHRPFNGHIYPVLIPPFLGINKNPVNQH